MARDDRGGNSITREEQQRLIGRLSEPALYGPGCHGVRMLETHISYVLLTGSTAYKIKKAVDLGFLDFTTLAARAFFCEEELRLNRRLAPSLYLDTIAVTGTIDAPQIDGDGPVLECAVRMREFPQHALLPAVLARGALTAAHVDRLGDTIAHFHRDARSAPPHSRFGTPADVLDLARENFDELDRLEHNPAVRRSLGALRRWTEAEHARQVEVLSTRRRHGLVRECHGDLHLGNIALIDGVATPFDCIEFNDRMRWSDVMNDVAFLTMDFRAHGRPDLASRFLNRYLETSGDYDGLPLLRFFVVYRAMVRAKVALLRAAQTPEPRVRATQNAEAARFVRVAAATAQDGPTGIVLTHGLSGAGKSTAAARVAMEIQGIHIRTDVERKRLFGLARLARTAAAIGGGIYSAEATRRTYERLATLARGIVRSGYVAVVDGAFLERSHRGRFSALAAALDRPFVILDCVAPISTLTDRLTARSHQTDEASEADVSVLIHQLQTLEPFDADESRFVVTCDTSSLAPGDVPRSVVAEIRRRLAAPVPKGGPRAARG